MAIQHRKATDDPTMACEDLKFFEKRVTEVIGFMGPSCTRWRISVVLCLAIVAVFISNFASERWEYLQIPFFFINFTTSVDILLCMSLVFLMVVVFGAHRRIVAPTM